MFFLGLAFLVFIFTKDVLVVSSLHCFVCFIVCLFVLHLVEFRLLAAVSCSLLPSSAG